jgi:gluconolactonase
MRIDVHGRPPRLRIEMLQTLASGIDHPEGICISPDGTLYVGGEAGQIYQLEADGTATQMVTTGGFVLGLAADGDGRIYACDAKRRAVLRWTPSTGALDVISAGTANRQFAPNWGAFGPDGTYYVSDSGQWKQRDGAIFVVRSGITSLWTDASVDFPNGLAVSPDGRELWVLESTPGELVRFMIQDDGTAGPREPLAELPGLVPDGIAFAADGSVVIACYRPDVVVRWRADLGIEVLAEDPEGTALSAPTNCVFHGPGLAQLAVANLGRWHVTNLRIDGLVGVPLFYPLSELLGS